MSKELIERLRADAESTDDIGLCADAADRIEELERENEALAKNLRGKHSITGATYAHLIYQRDALQADNARLREALEVATHYSMLIKDAAIVQEALAATPEQSLARHDNRIKEECAKLGDAYAYVDSFQAAIRSTKEQE